MPRNLDTRVELLVPVEDPELQAEIEDTLDRCLADDTFCLDARHRRGLDPADGPDASVHRELMERTLAQASTATSYGPLGARRRARRSLAVISRDGSADRSDPGRPLGVRAGRPVSFP